MAFPRLGPLGNIVENFTRSLNDIFGTNTAKNPKLALAQARIPGFDASKWTGNTNRSGVNKLRYGFRIVSLDALTPDNGNTSISSNGPTSGNTYYLDIPPQAISQKELFATQITATRRGVIVESEGVVFKDIIIAGTTGVFPGARDGFGGSQANFADVTKPPARSTGVDPTTGLSKNSTVVSGYTEFLALRAFFLSYAEQKLVNKGNNILVFINEKDQQALVVEPLEFNMERNSKNPMQYNYRIVLKCIAVFDSLVTQAAGSGPDATGLFVNIVNVSRNAVAAINQFRAALGATNQLVQSISQEIDKTFVNPLRLLGGAFSDVAEARNNVLAVPSVLRRNVNDAILSIQENRFTTNLDGMASALVGSPILGSTNSLTSSSVTNNTSAQGKVSGRGSVDFSTSNDLLDKAKAETYVTSTIRALDSSAIEALPRSFVQSLRDTAQALADDIADAVNLGDADYDEIKNRVPTIQANPLKVPTSNEYLLLGSTLKLISALDASLATNNLFLVDASDAFERDQAILQNKVSLQAPNTVREVIIRQNDTLERIALRELGATSRWVELAVLNNLKYPYIDDTKADGVKTPGDKLLIGN
jgi:hypothetical protein